MNGPTSQTKNLINPAKSFGKYIFPIVRTNARPSLRDYFSANMRETIEKNQRKFRNENKRLL
jgi:hypothetical protein